MGYIRNMGEDEALSGVTAFLHHAKEKGYLLALGPATEEHYQRRIGYGSLSGRLRSQDNTI